ncbi:S9 family peptidase [Streptomyces sp. SID3343]|uniref:S9 family peptidase n=1 Tax=Streptomyces sp. SID3343 TaxID=2690260 RepID=UPI00136AF6EF|nr:S9 family peptidase [Streptomyces sp. SID3343]MYW02717.1 prolyl oligopeptidase family serine peptidase [Streptomyces sp. SID3343]
MTPDQGRTGQEPTAHEPTDRSPAPNAAPSLRPLVAEDVYRLALPGDPTLHPAGDRIVYTLTTQDAERDRPVTELWEVDAVAGPARRLTTGPSDSSARWSPDGDRLAFLRAPEAGDGPAQLHVMPASGGATLPLTELPLGAGAPVWSPDGTRIAFSAPVTPSDTIDPNAPLVIDRVDHKIDGLGRRGDIHVHVHVLDTRTGKTTRHTNGEFDAGSPAWSPDGRQLAFVAASGPDADLTGHSAAYVLDLEDGEPAEGAEGADRPRRAPSLRPLGSGMATAGAVTWFPDASALLVTGNASIRASHLRLFRVPLDGGPTVDLTAEFDRNVMPGGGGYPGAPATPVGDAVVFCAREHGSTRLYRLELDGTITRLPLTPDAGVAGCSIAEKVGRAAVTLADVDTFGEIAVIDLATGVATRRTEHTAEALAGVLVRRTQAREFVISDGTRVDGYLMRDPDAPTPGPLLVDLHGGPHNAWARHADPYHPYHQILAALGWTILTLNIRGSDGYGEEFFTAALGAWGKADERDVLEPVAELIAEGLVDPARVALTGYSYGGYLTCWLSARSDVFAAAVPGGVVTDLRTVLGPSDCGGLLVDSELLDEQALVANSPITEVARVTVPTLILHGAADDRCPPAQAEQWFHALRTRGVPVRLVLYPGQSHLFILDGRPSHRVDYTRRVVAWVTEHTSSRNAL